MTTKRTRCFRVEIETPQDDAQKSITFHRQSVLEDDGEIIGLAKCQPSAIYMRFLPDVATQMHKITDPITGQTMEISGAAIAAWITAEYDRAQEDDGKRRGDVAMHFG